MSEKYMDSVNQILSSIDSMAKQIDQYQKDKKEDAKKVARAIDIHTLYAKKISELNKMKKNIKDENILDKLEQIKQDIEGLARDEDEKNALILTEINTTTMVDAIFAAPSGDDFDMLVDGSMLLRQKNNERISKLTEIYTERFRDSFLVKLSTDAKIWDNEQRQLVGSLIQMTRLVSLGIKNDNSSGNKHQYDNNYDPNLNYPPQIENKSEKYGVE